MTDLAFFIVTGGRTHWYNDAGELIIQSRPGDKCATSEAHLIKQVRSKYGEHLSTGEGHYYPDLNGFLCWRHALQRFIAAPSGLPQAKAHPDAGYPPVNPFLSRIRCSVRCSFRA